MRYITDKEIANMLQITEKSYNYQGKTKEKIELICNELIKRIENKHKLEIDKLKSDLISSIKAL